MESSDESREQFLKSELENICVLLNDSFEYVGFEDDEMFLRIFKLLMEIREKSFTIRKVARRDNIIIK